MIFVRRIRRLRYTEKYHTTMQIQPYIFPTTPLGVGLEVCFDPKKWQAIRNDQPKNIENSEKVKLPTYPHVLGFSVNA